MGKGPIDSRKGSVVIGLGVEDDFDFMDGDITISIINGIPSIVFSERVRHLLVKDIANTMVIKLLGRNIRHATIQNKIAILWKPSMSFQLMDIENGYFLAKFQNSDGFEKVLSLSLWVIYGQYLTV
ncbi:hypothetical protein J1N35_010864 [Gossypium stocksii]|uniref:DUF4283 domain-containing protein n=1 Tax=Gossypium stocksii TaxID=47602 RepID=A0A9D3W165_9ROSI|nr:hypothetical protein J1N35_010864 [Gossypium stocksii]